LGPIFSGVLLKVSGRVVTWEVPVFVFFWRSVINLAVAMEMKRKRMEKVLYVL